MVPSPFRGRGPYVQGVGDYVSKALTPPPDMGPGIQRDTVGKRVARILLGCFLVLFDLISIVILLHESINLLLHKGLLKTFEHRFLEIYGKL